jgi:23S rRNA-/tRNA-specific pseudouridylate synthase
MHFADDAKAVVTRDKKNGFGLCHRLDVGTSGPLLMGKTSAGYEYGWSQIWNRDCVKDYLALVHGEPSGERGACRDPIDNSSYNTKRRVYVHEDGAAALTIWEVMAKYESPRNSKDKYTLLHLRIITGRTHQIRVHLSHLGHPIVSDWTYANEHQCQHWTLEQDSAMCPRIFLHKFRMAFVDMEGFVCSVPCPLQMAPDLWNTLRQLRLVGGCAFQKCGAPGLPKSS